MTSSAHEADFKENNFRRTILPLSFIAVAFIFLELEGGGEGGGGGGGPEPARSRRSKNKAGLDRVKD